VQYNENMNIKAILWHEISKFHIFNNRMARIKENAICKYLHIDSERVKKYRHGN